jgi:hypothetical protein
MHGNRTRREFLRNAAWAGGAVGLSGLAEFVPLSKAVAADATVHPDLVRFTPEIEPIVRLFETTPRDKCLEVLVERLKGGLSYRHALAAVYLAGIRNVNPQPPGFKFHCVFVINSVHQLALDAPAAYRLLPLFYALDEFKSAQGQDEKMGDFRLGAPLGGLPTPDKAQAELAAGMDAWDVDRADRAITALVRSSGADRIMEILWRYGARDFRNIGHKAIFVASSGRTLDVIGWQNAEPVFRSLVRGLLDKGNYSSNFQDQAFAQNVERTAKWAGKLPQNWCGPRSGDGEPAVELLTLLRDGKIAEACDWTASSLASGKVVGDDVFDVAYVFAGEQMMRQPGIFGIHTVTSLNALRYAYRRSAVADTRFLLTLQGVAWMAQFQQLMSSPAGTSRDGKPRPIRITELAPTSIPDSPQEAAEAILASSSSAAQRPAAAAMAFKFAKRWPDSDVLQRAALPVVFLKTREAHGYKYPAAVFEDVHLVAPRWRPHLLAASTYYVQGSQAPDSPLMQRARDAVKGILG